MEDARVMMSTSWQQRLQNEKYKNWLKVGYAMSKVCIGTQSFIEREARAFHTTVTTTLHGLPLCTCIHTPRRRPNPHHDMLNCSWANELEKHHMKGRPTWNQSDSSLWHDPNAGYWQVAKLYMPYGCAKGNSCAETDATGLLNLLFFCNHYKTDRTLVERLKDTRNAWAHAATQELDATETTNAFSSMKDFLQDAELVGDADAIGALNEIIALENDDLIDFEDLETKVVNEIRQSMTCMKDELAAKLDSMKDQEDIHVSEIKDELSQINGLLNYCINVAKERDGLLLNILLETHSVLRDIQAQLAIQTEERSKRTRFVPNVLGFCKHMVLLAFLLYLRLPKRVPRKCIILAFLLTRPTILDDSLEDIVCGNEHKFHDPLQMKEIDFSEHLNQGRKDFVGRQWLFKDVSDTLNHETKGILIFAAPGFGKSALVSNLICSKLSSFSLHSQILGYHFCIHSHKNTQNGAKFVRNLANMIMSRLQEYRYLVMKNQFVQKWLRDDCASDPSACFDQGILSPLSELRLRFLKPMYVIVDAMDECSGEYELNKTTSIVNILSNNIKRFPDWLKVIITSRNVSYFKTKFSSLGLINLFQSDSRNLRDIERYIISHIPFSPLYHIKSYFTISDYSIQALVNKSQGNFLFIKLVLEYLQTKGVSAATWNSLPTTINSIYQEFFERNFYTKEEFRGPRKIFEILVATLSPLTREELYDVLLTNENPEEFDFEYDFLPILEELSVYLRNAQENQTLTVFHNSLIEWLTSKSNEGSMFYVNERKGNRLLADYFLRKCHNKSINITPRLVFNLATYITKGGKLRRHTDEFLRLDSKVVEIREERTKLNALHFAATSENKNILDMLLSFFEDVNVGDYNGRTPAFYAALSGHLENLILLHEEGASLFTVTNPSSSLEVQKDFLDKINNCKSQMCEYTLLHVAAQQGHEQIVEYLIGKGVDILSLSGTGNSAIHLAAEFDHVEVMEILFKHGAVVDDMCLYYGAFRGHVDTVKFLLDNEVTDNCIDCSKIRNYHLRKSHILVSYVNYTRHCNTALHAAAIGNYPDVMELLLKAQQNAIRCANLFGREPLHEAVHHENFEATNVLLKFGVKTSGICRMTLTDLSHYHDQEPCPCGYTPLHLAAHHGFAALTNLLLQHKADYNATDCEGMQPIHVASCREHAEVLQILVQHGANVNSKGPNDMTPLHYACKCRADQVLDTLFELGANDCALTINKKTPVNFIFQDTSIDKIYLLDPYVDNPIDPISFDPRGRAKSLQSKKAHNWFKFFMKFMNSLIRVSSTTMSFKERLIASLTKGKDQTRHDIIKQYLLKLFSTLEYGDLFGSTWSGMLDLFIYTTPAYSFYLDMVLVEPKLQEEYLSEFQFSKENILPTEFKKIFLKLFCKLNCSNAIHSIEKNLVFATDSLFDLGVDANCEETGLTPLQVYLRKGGSNMAKVLVKHNATINIQCGEYFEDSDFHLAAYHKLHYLQYLSVFHPSNKWEEYIKKENALFDYLFDEYDKKTVGEQVKVVRVRDGPVTKAIKSHPRGYKVIDECLDVEGYTALHRAAQGGNVVAVKHFLGWGANATKKSPEEFDALTLSIWYAIKYRPYLNLHEASILTSLEIDFASLTASAILKHLTRDKPFDIGCDEKRTTPTLLHLAATRGMWRFIDDLFIARDHHRVTGLTANCPTKDNITPMYLAKLHGGDECDWDNPWCKVVQVLAKYSESGYIEVRPQPFMEYFLILNFLFHELPERFHLDLDKKELMILQHSYVDYESCKTLDDIYCFPDNMDHNILDIIKRLDLPLYQFGVANTDFDMFLKTEISKIIATFYHLKDIKSGRCAKEKHSAKTTKQLPYTYNPNDRTERTSPIRRCSCFDAFHVHMDPDKVIKFLKHPPEDACFLDVCSPYKAIGIKIMDQVVQENYAVVKSYYRSLKTEMKEIRRAIRKSAKLHGKSFNLVEDTLNHYKSRRNCMFKATIYKYARLKIFLHTIKFWSVQVNKNRVLPFMSKYLFDKLQEVF